MRKIAPFDNFVDISTNLSAFVSMFSTGQGPFQCDWAKFVSRWNDDDSAIHVKYECLFDDCVDEISKILVKLNSKIPKNKIVEIVDRHSMPKDRSGVSTLPTLSNESKLPFIRKGGYGGWRDYFTLETAEMFNATAGDALIQLNYEKDLSWVEPFKEKN